MADVDKETWGAAPELPEDEGFRDYTAMLRLDGKTFVVLGGGQGIGRQTVHALASCGARTICVDIDEEKATKVAEEVGGVAYKADITSRDEMKALFEYVASLGELHGVVGVIGMTLRKPLVELTDDDWQWHHDMNIRYAYLSLTYATPMIAAAGGGSFTFVSSTSSLFGRINLAAYAAYKAALNSLVKSAALELGPLGIRVNAVVPGNTRTPRTRANPAWTEEMVARSAAVIPLRKQGTPKEIAGPILFMCSPLAGHITGQALVADGGLCVDSPMVAPHIPPK